MFTSPVPRMNRGLLVARVRAIACIALVVLARGAGAPYPPGAVLAAAAEPRWIGYTSAAAVSGLAVEAETGDVWAATSGGAVRWNPLTRAYVKLTAADGLLDTVVRSVAVDAGTGNRWFGTDRGASRLGPDGAWSHYTTRDGLPQNQVGAIATDPGSGDVWLGTPGGAVRLSAGKPPEAFTTADGLVHDTIRGIAIDPSTGDVWFATWAGVSRRSPTNEWTSYTAPQLVHDRVNDVAVDVASGDVWLATNGGVSQRTAAGQWQAYTAANGLPNNESHGVAVDTATGEVWVATVGGIARRDASGQWTAYTTADGLHDNRAGAVAIDPSTGDRWIGLSIAGVQRLSAAGDWVDYPTADGLAYSIVNAVAVDPATGATWLGTHVGGATRFTPPAAWETFTTAHGLPNNSIRSLAVDPATGDTWFGTGGGVGRLTRAGEWSSFRKADGALGADLVLAAAVDPATGVAWFGTWGGGVSRRSPDGRWTTYTTADGLGVDDVVAAAADPTTGAMWFGTWGGGASRRSPDGRWETFTTAHGLVNDRVLAIAADPGTGDMWFGTERGISRRSARGEWITVESGSDPSHDTILALAVDPSTGAKWIGRAGGGLTLLAADGTPTTFTPADGLTNANIKGIAIDPRSGDIWAGTLGGASHRTSRPPGTGCDTAEPLDIAGRVTAHLEDAADTDYYRIEVAEPFAHIQARLTDPDDRLNVKVFRVCGGNAGVGTGRHIGVGTGRHIGGQDQAEINVTFRTGTYYVAVGSEPGATDFPLQYNLQVSIGRIVPESVNSLILTHEERIAGLWGLDPTAPVFRTWRARLHDLARHRAVGGVVVGNVQTDTDADVEKAYARWLEDPREPSRANAVARGLRDWITRVRAVLPGIRYVVIAGDDRVIPHGRVSIVSDDGLDTGWLRETDYMQSGEIDAQSSVGAALALDQTLTDDVYAAAAPVRWGDDQSVYVPEIAVGRLVEHPDDMVAVMDAYLARKGELRVDRALTAGYSFMQDAVEHADAVLASAGLADGQRGRLWGEALSVAALRQNLFATRQDLAFLGVHASHRLLRLADGQPMRVDGVRAATADLAGTLAYALACHAGLNAPGDGHRQPYDFPEAWQRRGATWISSTGWAYGMDGFLAYQEVLLAEFTRAAVDHGGQRLGDALVAAKRDYYQSHDVTALHAKTLAGTMYYGLPHLRLRIGGTARPAGGFDRRSMPPAASAPKVATPDQLTALAADVWMLRNRSYPFDPNDLELKTEDGGSFFTFSGQRPRAEAGEPIQPQVRFELGVVDRDGQRLEPRGAIMTRARYHDTPNFTPLVKPADVLSPNPRPDGPSARHAAAAFDAPGWYPRIPVALQGVDRQPGTPAGPIGGARLRFVVGQFRASTNTERLYDEMVLDEYYSASADRSGPAVAGVDMRAGIDGISISLNAHDRSTVTRAVIAYTTGDGFWGNVEMIPDGTANVWRGVIPPSQSYFVQVADAAGNVTTVDDAGRVRRPCAGLCDAPGRSATLFLPYSEQRLSATILR